MKKEITKTFLSAVFAASAIYLKALAIPFTVLIFAMGTDYITGMVRAYISGVLSSRTGIKGIIKKLCYMFAVICGIIIDYILIFAADKVGAPAGNMCFFGTLITVWLILNEVVSILENLSGIGVPLPKFLKSVAERLKGNAEQSGQTGKAE